MPLITDRATYISWPTYLVFFVVAVVFLAFIIYVMCQAEIEDKKLLEMMRADDAKQAEEDARERRRMVYEADSYNDACNSMESSNAERLKSAIALQQATNAYNTDEYRRWLGKGIQNQHTASMEPFCGEGKKT